MLKEILKQIGGCRSSYRSLFGCGCKFIYKLIIQTILINHSSLRNCFSKRQNEVRTSWCLPERFDVDLLNLLNFRGSFLSVTKAINDALIIYWIKIDL